MSITELDFKVVDIVNESIFDYVDIIYNKKCKGRKVEISYIVKEDIGYCSKKYDKWIVARKGFLSDGATSAIDIDSFSWIFHDPLCEFGKFEDGSLCNNWQASTVLSNILKEEGRYIRTVTWLWATWLFGGQKARKNGMF